MSHSLAARLIGPFLAAVVAVPAFVSDGLAADDGLTASQKAEIGPLVRQYLLSNPEVIQEALQALDAKQKATAMNTVRDTLYSSKNQAVMGDPKAPITLVEFIDYNCGYCKRALGDTATLLDANKDVKIIVKEFPILGRGSVEAARVAGALNKVAPDKYREFHFALLGGKGQADEARALEVAEKVGANIDAVKAAMEDPAAVAGIQESYQIAKTLDINGTPAYVLGDQVLPGAVDLDQMKSMIDSVRSCGKTSC